MSTWNPLKKAEKSKTFCVFPWIHQYVGTLGDVKPCCVYDHKTDLGNLKTNNLADIWNNQKTKELRLKMLNGEHIDECQHCNVREFLQETHRTNTNAIYFPQENVKKQVSSTQEDGTVSHHKLLYIDIRFNNLCNFKCRTCSPHFSTSLIGDFRKIHNIPSDKKQNNELQFAGRYENHALEEVLKHVDHVQEVYFAGGEPLLQIEHYELLNALITNTKNDDYCVRYNTNLSNLSLHNESVLDYWAKIKNVRVLASLDANHARAEYWRKGTNWKTIVENRKKIIQNTPHVNFFICCTLSWPNSYNVVDFHKEWVEEGLIGVNDIYLNELGGPAYYALNTLPSWKKDKIKKIYDKHIEWLINYPENSDPAIREFENAIKFMYNSTEEFSCKDFHYYNLGYDKLRKENFFNVFPEHNDMKKFIEEQGYTFDF